MQLPNQMLYILIKIMSEVRIIIKSEIIITFWKFCANCLSEGEMQQTYADVIIANVNFFVAFKTILVPVWSLEESFHVDFNNEGTSIPCVCKTMASCVMMFNCYLSILTERSCVPAKNALSSYIRR